METINLNMNNDLERFELNKSSNDIGLEFLMNTSVNNKDKKNNKSNNIDLNDIDILENELNEISNLKNDNINNMSIDNLVLEDKDKDNRYNNVEFSLPKNNTNSTWDGYTSNTDEIPRESLTPKLTERQKRIKKMMMIQKLEEWSKRGLIELVGNTHYTIESSFEDIEDEYENALDNKRKKDSIKLQANVLIGCVGFIETANKWLNPFDIDLDGLQEKVTDELSDYDDIFAELFEKYKGGKLAPEVQLILKLGLTGATIAFTNKIFGGNPDFNNLLKTNPNIINAIQQEMVNTVNKKSSTDNSNPSLSSYLGGGPPPPIETKINKEQSSNRPDLSMARGTVFREQGIDLQNNNYQNTTQTQLPPRPEMRGPQSSQVNNILHGLKENVQFSVPPPKKTNVILTPSNDMREIKQNTNNILQTSHSQFPMQMQQNMNISQQYINKNNIKEFTIDNIDDLSISSLNINNINTYKEDNSDNISILSNDISETQNNTQSTKRGRKPKQTKSEKRISMDI